MTIKVRRDTAANWTSANPTLAAGQPGYETDTNKLKFGDGATAWASLSYFGGSATIADGDKGDVTVSSSGTVWTIDNGAVTLAKQADMATASVVYRKTAGAGAPEVQTLATLKTDLGLTGTNSGDQTTITGNAGTATALQTSRNFSISGGGITASTVGFDGTAAVVLNASVDAGHVTLARMANLAANSIIGNNTGSSATPLALTAAQVRTLLNVADGATANVGTVTSVGGTGTVSGLTLTGTVTGSGNLTLGGTLSTTSAALTDFNSATRAQVEAELIAGTNVTITPGSSGATRTLTIAATGGGGGGSPGGSTTQVQYNNAGSFAGAANVGVESDNLRLAATTDPATPTGALIVYAKSVAGRTVPKVKEPSGLDYALQASFWQNNVTMWNPTTETAGVWLGTAGQGWGGGTGTYSTALPTDTNIYTSFKRGRWANVVTTANQVLGQRNTEAMFYRGSAVSGAGGFFFFSRCGFDVWTNGGRFFAGMHSGTTVISANPSALDNTVGFCVDSTDNGAIYFLTRGTAATKAATGITIVSNRGYDLFIFCAPGSSEYTWRIVDLVNGTEASGTATLTLPTNTTKLTTGVLASNAALTPVTSIQLGVNRIYVETDY